MKPFKFECTGCGKCCTQFHPAQTIHADAGDLLRISMSLGRQIQSIEFRGGFCEYLDQHSGQCTIHEVKPKRCSQWPYVADTVLNVRMLKVADMICEGITLDGL